VPCALEVSGFAGIAWRDHPHRQVSRVPVAITHTAVA